MTHKKENKPKRIFCAEDDPQVRSLLSLALTSAGHVVETGVDGLQSVLRILSMHKPFDVVITDHHMPRVDGLELVRHLRANGYPSIIIVLSASLSPEDEVAYRRLSVDRILAKPIKMTTLIETIRDLSEKCEMAESVGGSAAL